MGRWFQGLGTAFIFSSLFVGYLYSYDDFEAIRYALMGIVWVLQYIYTARLTIKILDDEFYEEDDDIESDDPEAEYIAGGEIPPEYYLPETAKIPGWPGYRTRPGRSGYDPIDYQIEGAHMEGLLIRYGLSGKLTTRNPIYLFFMAIYGVLFAMPVIGGIITSFSFGISYLSRYIVLLPYGLMGVVLIGNFIKSIILIVRRKDNWETF